MPRKLAAMQHVQGPFYADFPGCENRYGWIVNDALKHDDPERLFNDNRSIYGRTYDAICKVCGGQCADKQKRPHMLEHARSLGLVDKPAVGANSTAAPGPDDDWPLFDDIVSTITDAIEGRIEPDDGELVFGEYVPELSRLVTTAIVADATEDDDLNAVFCTDCTES